MVDDASARHVVPIVKSITDVDLGGGKHRLHEFLRLCLGGRALVPTEPIQSLEQGILQWTLCGSVQCPRSRPRVRGGVSLTGPRTRFHALNIQSKPGLETAAIG